MPVAAAEIFVRPMTASDAARVLVVYAEGIEDGQATFETVCPAWADWDAAHLAECRFVALLDGRVAGWAALSPVSKRACYRGVAEVSVYVSRAARGKGLGRRERIAQRCGQWKSTILTERRSAKVGV